MTQATQLQSDFYGDHLSVRMFGAIGNGIADDSTAINEAIATVGAAGGGNVYLPIGTYLIGSDIVVNYDRVRLIAQGKGVTIRAAANNLKLIHWCGSRGGIDGGITLDASQPYTDLVIGSTTTHVTSAARPFTAANVGAALIVTSGTGFTAQLVTINSVSGGVAVCSSSLGTAGSTGGNATLVFAGVSGLRVSPLVESQTTTVVAQSFNEFYNVHAVWCDEACVLMCGPLVSGAASGCYYNAFYSFDALYCKRSVWLKDAVTGAGSSSPNRNRFTNLTVSEGITVGGTVYGSNTGIQLDAGDTNAFFGPSFEGILDQTRGPNAVPTAVIVKAFAASGAGNVYNRFFAPTFEACTRSWQNYAPQTEVYGDLTPSGTSVYACAGVMMIYPGAGYGSAPTVGFSGGGAGAVLPTAHAVVSGGQVSVVIDTPGSLMTQPPAVTFSGGSPTVAASGIALLTLPDVFLHGDASSTPVQIPGMVYPAGTLPGMANNWNLMIALSILQQANNQVTIGGTLAGGTGLQQLVTLVAPGGNWGVPLLLVTDGIGRGMYIVDPSFNQGTSTGTGLGLSVTGLNAITSGGAAFGPFTITANPLTLNGNPINFPNVTASLPLQVDGSNNLVSAQIDLTAQVTGVLPAANGGTGGTGGYSGTIATAKLTALGSNGSMTFTNGVLTAQTPAT